MFFSHIQLLLYGLTRSDDAVGIVNVLYIVISMQMTTISQMVHVHVQGFKFNLHLLISLDANQVAQVLNNQNMMNFHISIQYTYESYM